MPGITGWNKARLKRLIEDERYLGTESYPPLTDQDTFNNIQKIKSGRSTQKAIDRTADIFQLTVPVRCGECGQKLRRLHYCRLACGEKWICQGCGTVIKISDADFLQSIAEIMNLCIANPSRIESSYRQSEPSMQVLRMRNEIEKMFDRVNINKDELREKIYAYASMMYSELDTDVYVTKRLKAAFEESESLSCFHPKLTVRTVAFITLYSDRSVRLTLKNDQEIRKES